MADNTVCVCCTGDSTGLRTYHLSDLVDHEALSSDCQGEELDLTITCSPVTLFVCTLIMPSLQTVVCMSATPIPLMYVCNLIMRARQTFVCTRATSSPPQERLTTLQ